MKKLGKITMFSNSFLKVDGFMVVRMSRGRMFTKQRTNFRPAALFKGNRLIFNFRSVHTPHGTLNG